MPSLADLDNAFQMLWVHPEQLPTLLEKWQELVSETLSQTEPDPEFLAEFERYMIKWETVLAENRQLLQEHQKSLKSKLGKGQPKVSAQKIQEKFKR